MHFELNIGREQSTKYPTSGTSLLKPSVVRIATLDRFEEAVFQTYAQTTLSEPTVYAFVSGPYSFSEVRTLVHDIAESLCQECIGIRWADGTGELVGPYASEWPAFDNKYFRDPTTEGVPC